MNNLQSKVNKRILVFDSKGKIKTFKREDKKFNLDKVLNNFKTFDGSTVNFNKAFLTNNDTQMLSIQANDANKSLNMWDIETEKLISSFETGVSLMDISSNIKNGPVNEGNTVYGIHDSGYIHFDPRIKDMKVCENKYKTVHGLTNIISDQKGHFAIGSTDGHVRMYTDISQKRAKTDLPGFGDPIRELDVSKDGEWILATCAG